MRTLNIIWLSLLTISLLSSCQNKSVQLLSKKWDCVHVENLVPKDMQFQSAADSINNRQLQSVLQSLSWTFNNAMEYECAIDSRTTVKGTYEIQDDDKTLVCIPETKNSINVYLINALTENELILSSNINNSRLVLHFRPH